MTSIVEHLDKYSEAQARIAELRAQVDLKTKKLQAEIAEQQRLADEAEKAARLAASRLSGEAEHTFRGKFHQLVFRPKKVAADVEGLAMALLENGCDGECVAEAKMSVWGRLCKLATQFSLDITPWDETKEAAWQLRANGKGDK